MTRMIWTEAALADLERVRDKYVAVSVQITLGNPKEVTRLLKAAGKDRSAILERTDMQGRTLLHEAVEDDDLQMVRAIAYARTSVDVSGHGGTPAMVAAKHGQLEILAHLASKGANLNVRDQETGYSMLMAAIHAYQPAIALYLIDQKVDFSENVISKMGWSAVDFAATMSTPEVLFRLVEEGAMDARGGQSPIELAVSHHCVALVEACMAHPEYRKPLLGDDYEKVLKSAKFGEMRERLLSLRSQALISQAVGVTESDRSTSQQTRRPQGMSL